METFSLLLQSLDQTIDLRSLEEASMVAPSIARADCAGILRDPSGIVVSRLPREEALAFQAELIRREFPTDLVSDRELPVLHESFQIQRMDVRGEVLVFTDSMGREKIRVITDLVFLAGGFLQRIEFKTVWNQHFDPRGNGVRGEGMPQMVTEREFREEKELTFRLDFFFWSAPNRIHAALGKDNAIFHEERPLRLRDEEALRKLMAEIGALLPPQRTSSSLRDPGSGRVYPSFQSYEEEIRWHFQRLKPRA